ncbi:hypothetical protein BY458DRAFT_511350 [Sporodiniella umbellata]|nr:hypothetical protein BY458DRAFT_511350 [Sporodiniella umbellata]
MIPSRFLHLNETRVSTTYSKMLDKPPVLPEIAEIFSNFNRTNDLDELIHTFQEYELRDTNSSTFRNSTLSTLVNDDLSEWLAILVNSSPIQKDSVKEKLALAAAKRNAIKHNRWKEQMHLAWFETIEMMQDGWQ